MLSKYFGGTLPEPSAGDDMDVVLQDKFSKTLVTVDKQMDELAFNKALQSIWELVSAANKYIDDTAPWALAKDESATDRLGTVMYNLLESVRLISLLIDPFMPQTAAKIDAILGLDPKKLHLEGQDAWGGLQPGSRVAKAEPLFPRIETE